MAESTPEGQAAQTDGSTRDIALRIDESQMGTTYANTIRSYSTLDEVILDFGINVPTLGKQDEITFKVKHEVILNWRTSKRLALSLANLVRQHEERFGEIDPRPTTTSGGS